MKKINVFLAIIYCVVSVLIILCVEFGLGYNDNHLDSDTLLQAIVQILFCWELLLLFSLKSGFLSLLSIFALSGVACFVYKESIFVFSPLLLGVWFVKYFFLEGIILSAFPYFVVQTTAAVMGVIFLLNMNGGLGEGIAEKSIIVYVAILVIITIISLLLYLRSSKRYSKSDNKAAKKKRFQNYIALFVFLEIVVFALTVWYWVSAITNGFSSKELVISSIVFKTAMTLYNIFTFLQIQGIIKDSFFKKTAQ